MIKICSCVSPLLWAVGSLHQGHVSLPSVPHCLSRRLTVSQGTERPETSDLDSVCLEIPAPLVKVYGPAPGPVCREIVLQRFILLHLWSHPGLWPLETADQSCPSRYSPQVQSSRFSFVKNRSWHEPQFYQSCLLQIITDFLWASVSPYVKCEW